MVDKPVRLTSIGAVTRISVQGSGNLYTVRCGSDQAVRVWLTGDGLRCECGRIECVHVASLQMCGFVETRYERPQAA